MGYKDVILGDSPVGYWRLGDAGTPAVDISSGTVNNGTFNGTITTGVVGALAGDSDPCMSFDGSTGYLNIPYHSKLDIVGAISIEFWYKVTSYVGSQVVIGKDYTAGYYVAGIDHISFWTHGTELQSVTTNDNAWHYMAATCSGAGVKNIYLDGALTAGPTTQSAPIADASALQIGRSPVIANYYNGAVDEVAIYGGVLTATQVLNHYNVGITPHRLSLSVSQGMKRASYY